VLQCDLSNTKSVNLFETEMKLYVQYNSVRLAFVELSCSAYILINIVRCVATGEIVVVRMCALVCTNVKTRFVTILKAHN